MMYQVGPLAVAICRSVGVVLCTIHHLVGSGGMLNLGCIGHCCRLGWGGRNHSC